MVYRMVDHSFKGVEIYNCGLYPSPSIEEICSKILLAAHMKRHIPLVPSWVLLTAARILGPFGGKKIGFHPDRVKKLMIATNINCEKLSRSGYDLSYGLEESFEDWFMECDGEGLY